jgi:sugar O-acyltransferase (sialic acid O-acetyltransferase NeuD family)
VADLVRLNPQYQLAGYLSDTGPSTKPLFAEVPHLGGGVDLMAIQRRGIRRIVVAVGENLARMALAQRAVEAGFELTTLIHPRATVAQDANIGAGTVVMAGAVVNSAARIGANTVINTACSVDHECDIGTSASICPGAHLAGNVRIGAAAWIGIGAVVREGITIGDRAVIGAGAVVVGDIPQDALAYGVPARVVRKLISASHLL